MVTPTICAGSASRMLFSQRRLPDECALLELNQPPESHFERRILLGRDERFPGAEEIHFDEQQSRFDPRHVQSEHTGRPKIERRAGGHERVPDTGGHVPGHPDF